jgi:hypothetical protein
MPQGARRRGTGRGRVPRLVKKKTKLLELDPRCSTAPVNEGFSGGEKKRNEIFQMAVLEPKLAILDETDSGLDIDALRIVSGGVNKLRRPDNATLVITHYQRLLNYIVPDFVHVLVHGQIVKSGGKELALELEERGYDWILGGVAATESHDGHACTNRARTGHRQLFRGRRLGLAQPGCNPCARRPERARRNGFPTTEQEEWRFTNVAPLRQWPLHRGAKPARAPDWPADIEPFRLGARLLPGVCGWAVSPGIILRCPANDERIASGQFARAMGKRRARVGKSPGPPRHCDENFFTALNTAVFRTALLSPCRPTRWSSNRCNCFIWPLPSGPARPFTRAI